MRAPLGFVRCFGHFCRNSRLLALSSRLTHLSATAAIIIISMNMWEKVRKLKANQLQQPPTLTSRRQPQNPAPTAQQENLLSTFHPLHSGNNQPQKSLPAHQRHSSNPVQPSHSQDYAPAITLNGHMHQQNHLPTAHFQQKQTSNSQNIFLGTNQHEMQHCRSYLHGQLAPSIQSLNKSAVTFDWLTTSTFADLAATEHKAAQLPTDDIVEMSIIESAKEDNEVIDLDELAPHNAAQPLLVQRPPALPAKSPDRLGRDSSRSQSSVLGRKASKLKLRDYIYMVESTGRHSLSKGKGGLDSSESTVEKKQAKQPQDRYSLARAGKESTAARRKEQLGSKYSVPSAEMVEIIKKEVKQDIARITEQLARIDASMQGVQAESEQQSVSAQLLCLYQVRRQVKEEISKRVEATLALLVGGKGSSGEGQSCIEKQSSSILSNKL